MATRDPILAHVPTNQDLDLVIYGQTDILELFFSGLELKTDENTGTATRTESVNSHIRKRYPGASGNSVSSHDRVKLEMGTDGGITLPGFRFWCERPTGQGSNYRSNARQFNYVGNWRTLRVFALQNTNGTDFTLRNSSGRSVLVEGE